MVFDKDVKGGALPPSHKTPYARVWHLQDGKLIYGQAGSTEEIRKRMKARADGKDTFSVDLEQLLLLEKAPPLTETNPPEASRTYSSVKDFSDQYSAAGHHASCLDSSTGWTAARWELEGQPWVQMDAGRVVMLGGVVVQSWCDWSVHGVSKVRVETSDDGQAWSRVEKGHPGHSHIWDTPHHRNARNWCEFGRLVQCRFVRVVGVDYSDRRGEGTRLGYGASMRCGLLVQQALEKEHPSARGRDLQVRHRHRTTESSRPRTYYQMRYVSMAAQFPMTEKTAIEHFDKAFDQSVAAPVRSSITLLRSVLTRAA